MATTAFVRTRMDVKVKDKAAEEKTLPFDTRTPNKLTIETMEKSARGEDVHHAKNADDLFEQLGI